MDSGKLYRVIKEVLEEQKKKRDRCLKIADRKYDKPSAYKSGAVVRCRKGDIWKVCRVMLGNFWVRWTSLMWIISKDSHQQFQLIKKHHHTILVQRLEL